MGAKAVASKNSVYLFEIHDADAHRLNDASLCLTLLRNITAIAGLTEVRVLSHSFEPQGVSVISLLAESHIALHTWPESSSAYITLTTCKQPPADFEAETSKLAKESFISMDVKVGRL